MATEVEPIGEPTVDGSAMGIVESLESRSIPAFLRSEFDTLHRCSVSLMEHCLPSERDLYSAFLFKRLPADVWPHIAAGRRVTYLNRFVARGYWRELPR